MIAARWQFAFTIMFHYLFPVLTMGLGVLIAVLKTIELRRDRPEYGDAARFWARIFAITFATGVVTGIPMEFQFGTNWARFSHYAGPVVGQTLFMEGVFAFFAESSFLGIFLLGERRVGRGVHWFSSVMVALGAVRLRLLHRRHQRLDAAPGRLLARRTGAPSSTASGACSPIPTRAGSTRT